MLTVEEKMMLRLLTKKLLQEQTTHRRIDVSNRLRDDLGRFLPNESLEMQTEEYELPLDEWEPRDFTLVKVENTYGTYEVKEKFFNEQLIYTLIMLGGIIGLTLWF